MDCNRCPEARLSNFEPHTGGKKGGGERVTNKSRNGFFFNFGIPPPGSISHYHSYFWMLLDHTMFTDVDAMFEAKLIGHLAFGTFA